jgi:hypothetical protein
MNQVLAGAVVKTSASFAYSVSSAFPLSENAKSLLSTQSGRLRSKGSEEASPGKRMYTTTGSAI